MIIRFWLRVVFFLAVTAIGQARAQEALLDAGACLSCMVLHTPAAATASLDSLDGALQGLTIVVDASDAEAAAALSRIAAAGAEPGLTVSAPAAPPGELLRHAAVLIVRDLSDDDVTVFGLRTLAAAARAARPDIRILVDAGVVPDRARAYVDGRIVRGPVLARPTARELVEISRQGGAEAVLVTLRDVDWAALAELVSRRAMTAEVVAAGRLTAEQIVARHQAQQRRQAELVRRTIARGATTVMFEVPGFAAPVTVTAETTIYQQPGLTEIEQRDIRVNGAAIAGGSATSPPQLPLIEPERVATPPLVITLNDEYEYSLAGREQRDGWDAYVIRFEPRGESTQAQPAPTERGAARDGRNARGRAWIDATTFALRRLETVRDGLRGAIVSSEQHETFEPFTSGQERVWLPVRVNVYQRYEGAGHRTPIHRTIDTPAYDINPADFDARLQMAYASPHLMLRDTPQGLRYLLRDAEKSDGVTRAVAPRAGERVRTAVAGVLVDPNISVPLPFAGISYVDLNLFNTGAQLNAFFGGSYGQLSWSQPSIGRMRWRAHGRAFFIAASYNDRAFRGGVEQYRENIRQRPAHLSGGVTRPLVRQLHLRFEYELAYTAFDRADSTAPDFVVPDDALVHGLVAALDGEWGPWTAQAWWNPARRQRWSPWGEAAAAVDHERAFQRFGIGVARTLALGRIVSSRLEAAWMDGRDLDRFSRYSFGAFENRLRGYPTAGIRYDRGAVLRSVTSWAGRGFRVDAFGDVAAVRDPGFGQELRGYPGLGAAVELGGPLRTLWSVEWGYGFRARRSSGELGTQALRITVYRTF